MEETFEYRVVARNSATASENRIHADEVARAYGFRGGLVPGVTVYAYACTPVLEALGDDWLERGQATIRFFAPCYEGETLTATVAPGAAAPGDAVSPHTVAVTVGERISASGTAAVPRDPAPAVEIGWMPLPDERPPASEEVFTPGRVLGTVHLPTGEEEMSAYLETIDEPSGLFARRRIVHPASLLRGANTVLVANAVMPAWVHVESEIQHRRPVRLGESVQVRAVVADAFERKGHRFVVIDAAWMAGDGPGEPEPVANARHTAIWQLRAAGS